MRFIWLAWAFCWLACGDAQYADAPALAPATLLNIVAHPDDDLLFLQPQLALALAHGAAVTTVVVTAGQAKQGLAYATDRQEGLLWAYAQGHRSALWQCGFLSVAEKRVEHCRLQGAPVSLVFLGLPDGLPDGSQAGSLRRLIEGRDATSPTIARQASTYDRDALVAVLAHLVAQTQPAVVQTLDVVAQHGRDHSDHTLVGMFATRAVAAAHSPAPIVSYRGYNILDAPANVAAETIRGALPALQAYTACVDKCGSCGQERCPDIPPFHQALLGHRYTTSLRRLAMQARLQHGDQCLVADGAQARLGTCATATVWQFVDDTLRVGTQCLTADGATLTLAPCAATPAQWWRISDEGVLVGGGAAPVQADMREAHTSCVWVDGASVRHGACGGAAVTAWRLAPNWQLWALPAGGKLLAPARLDGYGVCARAGAQLSCAPHIDGQLGAWQALATALPIAVDDLVALGSTANGPLQCLVGGRRLRCQWLVSGRLGFGVEVDGDASDLLILREQVCVAHRRLECYGLTGELRAAVPLSAMGRLVEIDGDGLVDVCTVTSAQTTCDLSGDDDGAQRDVGISWAMGPASFTPNGDLDGDGRSDLCVVRDGQLQCGFFDGAAFGPALRLGAVPGASTPWIVTNADGGAGTLCLETQGELRCARRM